MIDDIVNKYLNEVTDQQIDKIATKYGVELKKEYNKYVFRNGWTEIGIKAIDSFESNGWSLKEWDAQIKKRTRNLSEAYKSKLVNVVYGKQRVIENWNGHKKLYVHKRKNMGYCVSMSGSLSLDDMVEIEGEYWFGTLKELHDSLNYVE